MKTITVDGTTLDVNEVVKHYEAVGKSADVKERHRAVFEDVFGVKNGVMKSYAEVAREFNVSSERVRQLCALVLYKIGLLDLSD
jgi:DNA-directed RNA polymerase sigma subunit (sigma70/sigma32)